MEKPRVKELVEVAGISKGYASDILTGKQDPSRPLALHIYRKVQWRHDCIASLSDAQIEMLAEIDPWVPMSERAS